jgi:hypothetical protein
VGVQVRVERFEARKLAVDGRADGRRAVGQFGLGRAGFVPGGRR